MRKLLGEFSSVIDRLASSGLLGIKSEFESEGVRINELNTLSLIAKSKGLKTALKIGGAEARTDMMIAFEQMSDYIIVPMIETSYAARKSIELYTLLCQDTEFVAPSLLINIETKTALENIHEILDICDGIVSGIVFGRVDFTLSAGLQRSDILSEYVCNSVLSISHICRDRNIEYVVGGGVSLDSIEFLKRVAEVRLDRFETRKCILPAHLLQRGDAVGVLKECVLAELLWLKAKSKHYELASNEDTTRIEMLEKRHLYNINSCGQ